VKTETEADAYIREVLREIRVASGERARVEQDLREHFAAAAERGEAPSATVARLGGPDQFAEALLSGITLRYASIWRRLGAFALDVVIIFAVVAPVTALGVWFSTLVPRAPSGIDLVIGGIAIAAVFSLGLVAFGVMLLYFPITEGRFGQTLGKRMFGLWVVRENGLAIGFKESFLRRLSFYFDFLWLDALFIPFTARRQRAFDIIARTIVVHER
jgi:uncharacterized RDD family membrane protein YckC